MRGASDTIKTVHVPSLAPAPPVMTAQGSAYTRFKRAIERKNLLGAEMTLREMREVNLLDALDYLVLLAELRPERAESAALRWHARLELEARNLTLSESQLALAALGQLCVGDAQSASILRRLVRAAHPTLVPRARSARQHEKADGG